MTIHTFHLAELRPSVTARALARPPSTRGADGLDHAESLALMRLGAPTVSPDRACGHRVYVDPDDERALELRSVVAGAVALVLLAGTDDEVSDRGQPAVLAELGSQSAP